MDWGRVATAIEHLQTLEADDLANELQRLAEMDAELAETVEVLHGTASIAASFMQTRMPGEDLDAKPALKLHDKVNSWEIQELLGSGGMGEVYKARRADGTFDQTVALKLAQSNIAGLAKRFETERQRLAQLEHPNIARIVDGGTSEKGAPYMTMEFVDGVPIDSHVKAAQLGREARLGLIVKLCAATAHAHGRLVLHRDIKHDNVLINAEGELRLIDFGVASLLDDPKTQTSPGPLTIGYAAPEQLLGDPVSAATDVFAIGMLTHLLETAALPKRQSDGGVAIDRAGIGDEDLAAILAKATASNAADRYGSADALGDDLRQFAGGFPVAAHPLSAAARFKKLVFRNKLTSAVSAAALAAVLVGVIGVSTFAVRANMARGEAEERLALAEFKAEMALINDHSAVATRDTVARLMSEEALERDRLNQTYLALEERYQREIEADPLLSGGKIFGLAREFFRTADHETSSAIVSRALARPEIQGALRAEFQNLQGRNFKEMGRDDEAVAVLTQAIEWFRQRPELLGSVEYAESLKDRLLYGPDKSDADEVRQRINALVSGEEDRTRENYWLNELSLVEQQLGNHAEYARLQEEAVKLALADTLAPAQVVTRKLAVLYPLVYGSPDMAKARQYLPELSEVREASGNNVRFYSQYRWKEAVILMREGRLDAAYDAIMSGVASAEANFPIGAGYHAVYSAQVVEIAALAGELETAQAYLKYIQVPQGADPKNWTVMRSKLARALYALQSGDRREAERLYQEIARERGTIRSSVELKFKFDRLAQLLES